MTTRGSGLPMGAEGTRSHLSNRRHVLDLDDFCREEIEEVLQNADVMKEVLSRDIRKVPTLRGKTIYTLFYEASTRTRASFEQAGKVMTADVINVSAGGSSVEKGESLYDTALTLQAMNADMIIMRHAHPGAPYFLARNLDAPIINAGDGAHAHPTQALLDYIHDAVALGTNRRSEGGDRRRYSVQPRRTLKSLGPYQDGSTRDSVRAADTDAARLSEGVPRRAPFRGSHHREQR